ncbi:hypothetical protein FOWG_07027 [Fusarium oxysporum f. sp. lycopersici MN25]|nr:hypothetical protein FOWG_07027 [Fusarium oxysporum f. sp. lycopersici MN25]
MGWSLGFCLGVCTGHSTGRAEIIVRVSREAEMENGMGRPYNEITRYERPESEIRSEGARARKEDSQSHIFVGNAGFMTTAAVAARQARSVRDRIMSRLVGGQETRVLFGWRR